MVGYLVGRIGLAGISLGAAGGVLLAGLLFGHFGFNMYPEIQTLGFAVFIFCVGYQAGPQFFDVLMCSGLKYLSLALVVAACGFVLSVAFARLFDFQPGIAAGLLRGALTTTTPPRTTSATVMPVATYTPEPGAVSTKPPPVIVPAVGPVSVIVSERSFSPVRRICSVDSLSVMSTPVRTIFR